MNIRFSLPRYGWLPSVLADHGSRQEGNRLVEVMEMLVPAGTDHIGQPHGSGGVERVHVHEGRIVVGPVSDPITIGPGDYARYAADRPHVYRSGGGDGRGILLVAYPPA